MSNTRFGRGPAIVALVPFIVFLLTILTGPGSWVTLLPVMWISPFLGPVAIGAGFLALGLGAFGDWKLAVLVVSFLGMLCGGLLGLATFQWNAAGPVVTEDGSSWYQYGNGHFDSDGGGFPNTWLYSCTLGVCIRCGEGWNTDGWMLTPSGEPRMQGRLPGPGESPPACD